MDTPAKARQPTIILDRLGNASGDNECYRTFCSNLTGYIDQLHHECPEDRVFQGELRNSAFAHFVAANRLIKTAVVDDPLLSEFRDDFASLSTTKYLQIIGLMHAYGARKCYADSPQMLCSLFRCIAASYALPDSITALWDRCQDDRQDTCHSARLRAQQIATILGRRGDAARLAPILHILDRKILLYLAFLVQEPELVGSIDSTLRPSEERDTD